MADGTPLELLAKAEGASALWIEIDSPVEPKDLVPGPASTNANARPLDLRLKRLTLEDLYVQLIGEAVID